VEVGGRFGLLPMPHPHHPPCFPKKENKGGGVEREGLFVCWVDRRERVGSEREARIASAGWGLQKKGLEGTRRKEKWNMGLIRASRKT